eukprot:gene640-235_t
MHGTWNHRGGQPARQRSRSPRGWGESQGSSLGLSRFRPCSWPNDEMAQSAVDSYRQRVAAAAAASSSTPTENVEDNPKVWRVQLEFDERTQAKMVRSCLKQNGIRPRRVEGDAFRSRRVDGDPSTYKNFIFYQSFFFAGGVQPRANIVFECENDMNAFLALLPLPMKYKQHTDQERVFELNGFAATDDLTGKSGMEAQVHAKRYRVNVSFTDDTEFVLKDRTCRKGENSKHVLKYVRGLQEDFASKVVSAWYQKKMKCFVVEFNTEEARMDFEDRLPYLPGMEFDDPDGIMRTLIVALAEINFQTT